MSDPKFYCRAEDLAIGYGKTPLMEHIGLGVGKGTILTLIGPNGAGKSTLLKTLAAQLAPQGGAVLLDGKDLADCSGPERARKMALMVPHTRRTELTTCFEMASAGRYPYTGRLGVLSAEDKRRPCRAGPRGGRGAGGPGLQPHQRRPAPARPAGPGHLPAAGADIIRRAYVFS